MGADGRPLSGGGDGGASADEGKEDWMRIDAYRVGAWSGGGDEWLQR